MALLDKKELVDRYLKQEKEDLSVFSFISIFAWKDFFDFRFEIIDDHLCVFAQNEIGCFMYLPPLGPDRTPALFDKCFGVMEEVNKGNGVSRIENVSERMKPLFPEDGYSFYPKGSEYFYQRQDIAALKGNAYKSKRSSFNQFVNVYNSDYCAFDPDMTDECLALYDEWAQQRRQASADDIYHHMLIENRQVHQRLMSHYQALGLIGRVVKVDNQVKAYTFGYEIQSDTFCVFAEVADLNPKGLPVYIFSRFCQDEALKAYSMINVMDDFELENIKKTKMSFHPAFLKPLYVVKKQGKRKKVKGKRKREEGSNEIF